MIHSGRCLTNLNLETNCKTKFSMAKKSVKFAKHYFNNKNLIFFFFCVKYTLRSLPFSILFGKLIFKDTNVIFNEELKF